MLLIYFRCLQFFFRNISCRAPGGLLLPPRHAARAAAAVASAAAGVRGARGRGDAGPERGRNSAARPTLASSPQAPGSGRPRIAGAARMDRRARGRSGGGRAGRSPAAGLRAERARPGRRARSHPRRGPRAQRRALAGPARGPRSMPRALCWAGAVWAPRRALPRLPWRAGVSARNFLGPSPRRVGVTAGAFSARVAALSLCASEADRAVLFLPHLV